MKSLEVPRDSLRIIEKIQHADDDLVNFGFGIQSLQSAMAFGK